MGQQRYGHPLAVWLLTLVLVILGFLIIEGSGAESTDLDLPTETAAVLCTICWSVPSRGLRSFATKAGLTHRELQVARCASVGSTSSEIAAHLGISCRTVEVHLRRTYLKLDIHSRTRLAYILLSASAGGSKI